jgi:hypothetical protein
MTKVTDYEISMLVRNTILLYEVLSKVSEG